jgi:hypothetical protein
MGLFDSLFSDNPNDAAYLALASGLLGGKGSFNSILGNSLAGAQGAYSGAADAQMKRQLMKAQIGDIAAQEELRKQQAKKYEDTMSLLKNVLGGSGTSQYGAAGSGISLGGVQEPMIPSKGGLAGANPEQIAMLKAGGVDIENLFNKAQFGEAMQPGYRRSYGGGMDYMPDPTKSLGYNLKTNQVSLLPGAAEAQGSLAGATTEAQKAAEAKYTLKPFIVREGPNKGSTEELPLDVLLNNIRRTLSNPPPDTAPREGGMNAEAVQIMRDSLARETDPAKRASMQREINDALTGLPMGRPYAERVAANNPSAYQPPVIPNVSGGQGIKTGLSPAEAAQAAGLKATATTRGTDIANYITRIQESGADAGEKIDIARQIQKLYGQYEGGKLSNFGMSVASAANGIGITLDPKLGDKENAIALASGMALEMKNKGGKNQMQGNFSDADRNFMVNQAPTLIQTAKGRRQIIDGYVAMREREQQVQQWMNNYMAANNGQVDEGFFNQLRAYTSTHSVFKK